MTASRHFARFTFVIALALSGCSANGSPASQVLARTCVLVEACKAGEAFRGTVGQCASVFEAALNRGASASQGLLAREAARLTTCGSANSCASFADCVSMNHGATYCAAHPGDSCDGNVLVVCGADRPADTVDCSAYGMQCRAVGTRAVCTTGNACAASMVRCEGSRRVTCNTDARLEVSIDCAEFGPSWTCGATADGMGCVPPTPACTADATRCDGDTLVTCPSNLLRELRSDCASVYSGGHCSVIIGRAQCVPGSSACDDSADDVCTGAQIQSCVSGRRTTVDCAALGFRACQLTATGSNMRAVCVN
ncbi:MAG: hypothetical protein U0269_23210 [Polyangiales bacterium]